MQTEKNVFIAGIHPVLALKFKANNMISVNTAGGISVVNDMKMQHNKQQTKIKLKERKIYLKKANKIKAFFYVYSFYITNHLRLKMHFNSYEREVSFYVFSFFNFN